jgi:hypothetical protein
MALTKGQSMALYLLLTTDSKLSRDVTSLVTTTAPSNFLTGLLTLVQGIDPSVTDIDPRLQNLFPTGVPHPQLDLSSPTVKRSLQLLAAAYGGGPCPGINAAGTDDQKKVWNLVAPLM